MCNEHYPPHADAAYDVAAIIVNYNGAALLSHCLEALRSDVGSVRLQTIVVDNGSTDGSADLVRADGEATQLLHMGRNLGFSRANNAGVRSARARYYLFLNTDCFVRPGLLDALTHELERRPDLAVVGPRLLNPDDTLQPSAHNFPSPLIFFLEQSSLWRLLRRFAPLRDRVFIAGSHDCLVEADWLVGACFMVRADAFVQAGGFDEEFFFYWEETDLCMRLRRRGLHTLLVPTAQAVHIGGGSSGGSGARVQFFRSLYRLYRKHYSQAALLTLRIIVRLLSLAKVTRLLFESRDTKEAESRESAACEIKAWFAVARL